jgi:hypothetical protein
MDPVPTPPPPVPFVLEDIPDMIFRWRANQNITVNGSNQVTSWLDSVNGYNLNVPASQPMILKTEAAELNGFPQVFSTTNQNNLSSAVAIPRGPITLMLIIRTSAGGRRLYGWQSGTTDEALWTRTAGGAIAKGVLSIRGGVESSKSTPTNWGIANGGAIFTKVFDGTHAGHLVYLNGATVTLTTVVGNNPGTGIENKVLAIGSTGTGYAEIVAWGRRLTVTELNDALNLLGFKYNLPQTIIV